MKCKIFVIKEGYVYEYEEKQFSDLTDFQIILELDRLFFGGCKYKGNYVINRHQTQTVIFETSKYNNQKKIEIYF